MECIKCLNIKTKEDFREGKNICRKCECSKSKKYYQKNKDVLNAKMKEKRKKAKLLKDQLEGITENTKKCKGCDTVKDKDQFSKGRAMCIDCIKIQDKERYERNKEEILERRKQFAIENKEIVRERRKKYRAKKKQEYLKNTKICSKCKKRRYLDNYPPQRTYCKPCAREMCRSYKARNKDKISAYNKQYKVSRKDEISEYNQKYFQDNKDAINKRRTPYFRNLRKTNIHFKISSTLRVRLLKIIKAQNAKKTNSTLVLLGCDLEFFLQWFKFRFEDDMTFKNHGSLWHIDHVIPCSLFDVTKDKEQERCFHWTNLQPLYGLKNLKKNNTPSRSEIMNQMIKINEFIMKYEDKHKYELIEYNRFQYL